MRPVSLSIAAFLVTGAAFGAGWYVGSRTTVPPPDRAAQDAVAAPSELIHSLAPNAPVLLASPVTRKPAASSIVEIDLKEWAQLTEKLGTHVDPKLWPDLIKWYGKAGRTDDVLRVARAVLAAGGDPSFELEYGLEPEAELLVVRTLKSEGFEIASEPTEWAAVLARGGRATEALDVLADVLGGANYDRVYPILVRAFLVSHPDTLPNLTTAEADLWSSSRAQVIAEALGAAGRRTEASAWQAYSARRALKEEEEWRVGELEGLAAGVEDARAATTSSPTVYTWVCLGDALLRAQDRRGAAEVYLKALAIDPHSSDAAEGLSKVDPRRAIETIEAAWRTPGSPIDMDALARIYLRAGRGKDAAEFTFARHDDIGYDVATSGLAALAPHMALAWLTRRIPADDVDSAPQYRIARADALAALGRVGDAIVALPIIATPSNSSEVYWRWEVGDRLLRWDPAALIERLDALSRDLRAAEVVATARIAALRGVGKLEESRAAAEAYVAAHPEWLESDVSAAYLAVAAREVRLSELQRAADREAATGRSPDVLWTWCRVCVFLGRTADARKAFDQILDVKPDDMDALVGRLLLR